MVVMAINDGAIDPNKATLEMVLVGGGGSHGWDWVVWDGMVGKEDIFIFLPLFL